MVVLMVAAMTTTFVSFVKTVLPFMLVPMVVVVILALTHAFAFAFVAAVAAAGALLRPLRRGATSSLVV